MENTENGVEVLRVAASDPDTVRMFVLYRELVGSHLSLITVFVITYISLRRFTNKVEDLNVDRTYVCKLELHQN